MMCKRGDGFVIEFIFNNLEKNEYSSLPPLYENVRFYITISGFIINMLCIYM